MLERDVNTGVTQLDDDLKVLFDFCTSERLKRLQEAAANDALTEDNLADFVPEEVLRAASVLSEPSGFEFLRDQATESSRPVIEEAKALVDHHLNAAFRHPAIIKRAEELVTQKTKMDDAFAAVRENLNVIAAVGGRFMWTGIPPKLTPALHVAFLDSNSKLLLDSLLEWDDVLFVASGLVERLSEAMGAGQKLADQLDIGNTVTLAHRILNIEKALAKLKSLAAVYGIDFESVESGEDKSCVNGK